MSLFVMPLYVDRFVGATMTMSGRVKSAYLWCLVALWQTPKIKKEEFVWVVEDAWGGEVPPKEMAQIMSKLDLDDDGFVFSQKLEIVRIETIGRVEKNNAKRTVGGEVTALCKEGYDKKTAREIANIVVFEGLTRDEAKAKLKPSLSQAKAEKSESLTQGNPNPNPNPNTLDKPIGLPKVRESAHASARPQTAVPTFYNPPITYPERADFVAYGMTQLGHIGLTDKDWNTLFSEAVASEWKDVNGKPWGNWKGKIVHKAKDYAKAKESGERDPDMLTKNLSKSMMQGLLMDKQKELTPQAFSVDENGFETFDPDKIVEPKRITA